MDAALPTGIVTFLLTDIEGSTQLWEQQPEQMRDALARHDQLFDRLITQHAGVVVKPRGEGDSRFAVFSRPTDAVAAATAVQLAFFHERWPLREALRVRMAIHTGEADVRDDDYYGNAVNRCARLRAIAHGGQLLLSAASAALVGDHLPAGATVRDLGTHRLKDLGQPEHVYEVVCDGVPSSFPALNAVGAQHSNLPIQTTSFIGRENERSELRSLLHGARVVTITGPGGAGKTRLATRVSEDMLDDFSDGVWIADLAPLMDGSLLPRALAVAIGVREEPSRPLLQILLDTLRPKRAMIVFDNCEQVVRACALVAETLLQTCPNLSILATTREPLGVAGEISWSVPPLSLPIGGPHASRESILAAEAVALFVDRAADSQPGFVLSDGNASAVAEICRRLDGMPLAIELAAARVRVLSPEQIARRLDQRFRLLRSHVRTAPSRQQTLQAAIDWSYELLSPGERTMFARLSVFTGRFDLDAAENVCIIGRTDDQADEISTVDVLDLLSQLVDKSLVVSEPAPDRGGSVRYRLLETLREYARERLAERDETVPARRAHARYYQSEANLAETHLRAHEQADWLIQLEDDYDNLLSALKWSADSGEVATGLTIGCAIFRFWATRHPREGSEWLSKLLSRSNDVDPRLRARALNVVGNLAQIQGDIDQAIASQRACVSMWRTLNNATELSIALNSLGGVLIEAGRYAEARVYLDESLQLRRAEGDPRRIAVALANHIELERRTGRLSHGLLLGNESLAFAQQSGDEIAIATSLNNLGAVECACGHYEQAATLLTDAVLIFHRLGDRRVVAECWRRLAEVACCVSRGAVGARLLGASTALRESYGIAFLPTECIEYDRTVAAAVASIGEDAYVKAWSEGYSMPVDIVLDQVIPALAYSVSG